MPGYDYAHLLGAMTQKFLTDPFPDAKPGDQEYDMTQDLIVKIAQPVHEHIVSWWNETGGGIFPDENVKMIITDPTSGYLADKIDNDTIKYNETTYKLYVNSIPVATNQKLGGIIVGVNANSILYMNGSELMARVNTTASLSDLDNEVPSCRAVKLYVTQAIENLNVGGGTGDMLKSTYDSNNNGIVDNSEKLNGQSPSYYLDWNNINNKPSTYNPSTHGLLSHTVSSLTEGYFLKATGSNTYGFVAHGLGYADVGAEGNLGLPDENGYVLSSTTNGTRSWIPLSTSATATYGTRQTGYHAGSLGELYVDDDYLYACVVAGGVGVAVWKRTPLMAT